MDEDDRDEYGRGPWLIESVITNPERVRVRVAITMRADAPWDAKAVGDCAEIAQMTAARAMTDISKCRENAVKECPF